MWYRAVISRLKPFSGTFAAGTAHHAGLNGTRHTVDDVPAIAEFTYTIRLVNLRFCDAIIRVDDVIPRDRLTGM